MRILEFICSSAFVLTSHTYDHTGCALILHQSSAITSGLRQVLSLLCHLALLIPELVVRLFPALTYQSRGGRIRAGSEFLRRRVPHSPDEPLRYHLIIGFIIAHVPGPD